ncbi:sigma-E factor regulatory protein RseB domain-containing protein [Pseudonocardia sp. GCM10023141]|uniref:sigma-E factor regulatory protein RseB domain-containing protein n=1 Tax=Pseudonocardia sp. GCM10023141 TaxID=3252653 RepID=UPI00361C1D1A
MAAHRFSRRWLLVAAGAAGLVGASAVTLPAAAIGPVDPAALRDRILGSDPPYVGLAESTGRLGLPQIPQLESMIALLTGTTRVRAYVAGAQRWRADEINPAGERDTYHLGGVEFVWDFGANQLTSVLGQAPVRLLRAGDMLPPDLARRLLQLAPTDTVTALPPRRIAGRTGAGLRLTPADPDTLIGPIDVWADPVTALPLRVEVSARTGAPLLTTEFLEISDGPPAEAALVPPRPVGAGIVTSNAADLGGALRVLNPPPPPDRLAGRDRRPNPEGTVDLPGVGVYGSGLAGFVLIPANRDIAERAIDGATVAGGVAIAVSAPLRAARVATPLLSVAARSRGRSGELLVGSVAPEVLEQAVLELPVRRRP